MKVLALKSFTHFWKSVTLITHMESLFIYIYMFRFRFFILG